MYYNTIFILLSKLRGITVQSIVFVLIMDLYNGMVVLIYW